MGSRVFIGVAEPDGAYTAYYLHWGEEHPVYMVPRLRSQWREQYGRDTAAMASDVRTARPDNESFGGHLTGAAETDILGLYLINEPAAVIDAYVPARDGTWELYSRHPLDAALSRFELDGKNVRCGACRGIDTADFTTTASPNGGLDAVTRCETCDFTEITDPAGRIALHTAS